MLSQTPESVDLVQLGYRLSADHCSQGKNLFLNMCILFAMVVLLMGAGILYGLEMKKRSISDGMDNAPHHPKETPGDLNISLYAKQRKPRDARKSNDPLTEDAPTEMSFGEENSG